ncbi:MAG: RluA family pseudouridine synthase [Clostridiales bacterium]|nr:RluA family pseudouridine synthase [Clostridiales bacterium]
MTHCLTVEESESGGRVDSWLSAHLEGLSRSYLQKLITEGHVTVNGGVVKSNYRLSVADKIVVDVPDPVPAEIRAEEMDLDILYEDEDLLFVNKPKGLVVHPSAGHESGTLVNGLLYHCRDSLSGINGVTRPGIVHRIDMDTTGVLVVCKNDAAHSMVAAQLKEHSINRRYYAIVHGVIRENDGTVNAPIGRHPVDRKRMSVNNKNGREAVTHYHVLARSDRYSYIECRLETGRTHQIRVHMASIGHPLLGDCLYGPARCPISGLSGQTLHAGVLGLNHPRTREYIEVTAPLPEYFTQLLNKLHLV